MVCSKCKVDCPIEKFDTYFHSTKNKHYTRRICNPCMRLGYREYKLKIKSQQIPVPVIPDGYRQCSDCKEIKELNEINFRKNCGTKRYYCNRCDECQKYIDKIYAQTKRDEEKTQKQVEYSTNPNYKQCNTCMEYKHLTDFYLSHSKNPIKICKICHKKYYRKRVDEKISMNGGSNSYYADPNKYFDNEQKEQVFSLMKAFGWIFDKSTGIWNKPGVKENGVFINMILQNKPKRVSTPGGGRKIKKGVWNSIDNIMKLIEEGHSYSDIADIYCCSHTLIRSVVSNYRNEKRAS